MAESNQTMRAYPVWDAPTRWFHWINALCVLLLIFVGLVFLFREELGLRGVEAKIALQKLHVGIGYVFAVNLGIRLCWAFFGNRFARFTAFIPRRRDLSEAAPYFSLWLRGRPPQYLGHNPAGRIAVSLMFLLMILMLCTGLIRAGIDLYYPPLGGYIADYIAAPGVDPASLQAGDPELRKKIDAGRYQPIRKLKMLTGRLHKYGAFALMAMVFLHILFVALAEIRHHEGIVSAMFSGRKRMGRDPPDL